MKTYTITLFLGAAALLASCSNWLDLKPETQATEKQIFSTGEGYRSVLNGLYKSMGTPQLYGRELSFGFVDCISQQYDLTLGKMARNEYMDAAKYAYGSQLLNPVIDKIWDKAFNIIANSNNLLQNIKTTSPDFFSGGATEQRLIMGEAYACRASVHFDLLRLFAPAPVNDDKRAYVPYVETYPEIQANGIDVEAFLGKVITDLETALTLVADFDTTALGKNMMATADSRFFDKRDNLPITEQQEDVLYKGRGYRLNYYSITALLARVYQYAGKHTEALACAEKAAGFQTKGIWGEDIQMFKDDFYGLQSGSLESRKDQRVLPNLIFAIYNNKAYDEFELEEFFKIKSGALMPSYLVINMENQKIFENKERMDEANTDIRARYLIFKADGVFPLSAKYYNSSDIAVRDRNLSVIPMIRLTEMSYIAAECYARQNNFGKAAEILNTVRSNRDCTTPLQISNWGDFVEELVRDARREWISEGQLFYLYKRLNAGVDFGKNIVRPLERQEYLLPIPDSQSL